jgi:hypothetical protein
MTRLPATNTIIYGSKNQEMDMREILGGMEELANMICIRASHQCEIISIEPPSGNAREWRIPPQNFRKKDSYPCKAQVINFRK